MAETLIERPEAKAGGGEGGTRIPDATGVSGENPDFEHWEAEMDAAKAAIADSQAVLDASRLRRQLEMHQSSSSTFMDVGRGFMSIAGVESDRIMPTQHARAAGSLAIGPPV